MLFDQLGSGRDQKLTVAFRGQLQGGRDLGDAFPHLLWGREGLRLGLAGRRELQWVCVFTNRRARCLRWR